MQGQEKKQRRRRRQQERQKSIRFRLAKQQQLSFSFPELVWYSLLAVIQLQKNLATFDELNEME